MEPDREADERDGSMTPESREGTCPWCGREDKDLRFVVWYFDALVFAEWICERCRRILRTASVDENED